MSIPFSAALFAGGRQSRFEQDKSALPWQGRALWEKQIGLLEELNPSQLLIYGQPDGPYAGSKYQFLADYSSRLGPLAGLSELISACTSPRLLILDVNMCRMTLPVLHHLLSFEGVVPEHQGIREGTTAVYPVEILPLVRNTMQSPSRSLEAFIRLALNNGFIDTWTIPEENLNCFTSWDGISPS